MILQSVRSLKRKNLRKNHQDNLTMSQFPKRKQDEKIQNRLLNLNQVLRDLKTKNQSEKLKTKSLKERLNHNFLQRKRKSMLNQFMKSQKKNYIKNQSLKSCQNLHFQNHLSTVEHKMQPATKQQANLSK